MGFRKYLHRRTVPFFDWTYENKIRLSASETSSCLDIFFPNTVSHFMLEQGLLFCKRRKILSCSNNLVKEILQTQADFSTYREMALWLIWIHPGQIYSHQRYLSLCSHLFRKRPRRSYLCSPILKRHWTPQSESKMLFCAGTTHNLHLVLRQPSPLYDPGLLWSIFNALSRFIKEGICRCNDSNTLLLADFALIWRKYSPEP